MPPNAVNARLDAHLDESRIPVIIQLSDWQLAPAATYDWDPDLGTPNSPPAWDRMGAAMDRFKTEYNDGIFIGVGFEGSSSVDYRDTSTSPPTGNFVTLSGLVQSKGLGHWGVIDGSNPPPPPYNSTHSGDLKKQVLDYLWDTFQALAPLDPGYCVITDPLPVGLVPAELPSPPAPPEYDINVSVKDLLPPHNVTQLVTAGVAVDPNVESVTVAKQTDPSKPYFGQYVVEVKFKEFPTGEIKVEIVCAPVDCENFDETNAALLIHDLPNDTYMYKVDNTGHIAYRFEGDENPDLSTNTTYHAAYKYPIKEYFRCYLPTPLDLRGPTDTIYKYGGDTWVHNVDGIGSPSGGGIPSPIWHSGFRYDYLSSIGYYLDSHLTPSRALNVDFTVTGTHTVIYPYSETKVDPFKVTETFRKIEGSHPRVHATNNPDKDWPVLGGDNFDVDTVTVNGTGNPPATILGDDGNLYVYVGFEVDSTGIVYDRPSGTLLTYVTDDHTITYFYARLASKTALVYEAGVTPSPDNEQTGTPYVPIIARPGDSAIPRNDDEIDYRIYLNIPPGLQNSGETITVTDVLPQGLEYVSSSPTVNSRSTANSGTTSVIETVGWTFHADSITTPLTVRVKVITRPPPGNNFVNRALVTLNQENRLSDPPYIEPYYTNYTYHSNVMPGPRTLHIRQIILDPPGAPSYAELPPVGHFQASNGTGGSLTNTNLLSTSGPQDALGTLPFTIYTFPGSPDPLYRVETIVPQYYEWVNFQLAHTPIPHVLTSTPSPALSTTRPIPINFLDEREYWLTVYLRPKPLNTGQYAWDFRTNVIGRIWPPTVVTPSPEP